jgi:hypothetical protein
MSHAMQVEMIVVISVVSSLVLALIIVILTAGYVHALADLRHDDSVYSLSVEGDISHLKDRLCKLPWVIDLKTEIGPVDASRNLATTLLIRVTDPRKAERELPRFALEDATVAVTAFSRGRRDRLVKSAPTGEIRPSRTGAGLGRRAERTPKPSMEPRLAAVPAAQVEQSAGLSSVGPTMFTEGQ